ncbi:rhomboid family intramembrane serine protease [Candidatus Methylacidithermus pantelleriae]|uniref:Rhomboid family intramembrane serine protease n=1 Tax=Candidatus Methylacidithermus pantelleriae TaxID=2744239 RepID=A0A8J2BPT2_9BACT|nr:rhomboid family intramembrane serine protease [Candidatus Methylacidithermus pantelleriae]CAF0697343.1 Rhomboid family intramembrane serine protease [Candidatus Methylacidithermus pantelleriae]
MFPVADTAPAPTGALATRLLILANALVFLLELALPEEVREEFFYLFGIVPARFTHPRWAEWVGFPVDTYWPFLTYMFLHGGWIHILGNMWTLWIFGDNVEARLGSLRFVFFYLFCGLCAALVHMETNPDSTLPTVGASGAIAGVMGAYFVWFPRARIILLVPIFFFPFFFEVPAFFYLGFWALSQWFSGSLALASPTEVGGIAWWAHVGGFIAGATACWVFRIGKPKTRPLQPDEMAHLWAWHSRR